MTDTNEERAKFEAWAAEQHWRIARRSNGAYISQPTQEGWYGWQARAAQDEDVLKDAASGPTKVVAPTRAHITSAACWCEPHVSPMNGEVMHRPLPDRKDVP